MIQRPARKTPSRSSSRPCASSPSLTTRSSESGACRRNTIFDYGAPKSDGVPPSSVRRTFGHAVRPMGRQFDRRASLIRALLRNDHQHREREENRCFARALGRARREDSRLLVRRPCVEQLVPRDARRGAAARDNSERVRREAFPRPLLSRGAARERDPEHAGLRKTVRSEKRPSSTYATPRSLRGPIRRSSRVSPNRSWSCPAKKTTSCGRSPTLTRRRVRGSLSPLVLPSKARHRGAPLRATPRGRADPTEVAAASPRVWRAPRSVLARSSACLRRRRSAAVVGHGSGSLCR